MTTHRRYYFNPPGAWTHGGHRRVKEKLEQACSRYWWFDDPIVEGEPYGFLTFSFTSSGRDQWWCHTRAMGLAVDCFYILGFDERTVPVPMWDTLEPHTNRGRNRHVARAASDE